MSNDRYQQKQVMKQRDINIKSQLQMSFIYKENDNESRKIDKLSINRDLLKFYDDPNEQKKSEIHFNKREQLQKIQNYQKGYHLIDIIISIIVFASFQILSLIAQGKLFIQFNHCYDHWIALLAFILVFLLYILFVRIYLKNKMKYYKRAGYKYNINLSSDKIFFTIFLGGAVGGFMQSLIGVGSGHCMVGTLIYIGLNQRIASATSGYQIFFIGLSSLIQAEFDGRITLQQIYWYFGIIFVFGGILTFILYWYLEGKKKILTKINGGLCVMAVLATIPSIVLTQYYYGWNELLNISYKACS